MSELATLDPEPTADNDELDLIACCLSGWDPADVDLTPDAFRDPRHEAAWRAICTVATAGNQPNPATAPISTSGSSDSAMMRGIRQ